jgi:hypothetical protein
MDFTLRKYIELLDCLKKTGYRSVTFEDYCKGMTDGCFVILRHDVDLKAENSLATAQIEHSLGIHASYYFRIVKQSNKPDIIRAIAELGHEIGYHYEDLSLCNGDVKQAINCFEKHLEHFRQYYPVKTICMHGAPRSKYDSKDLWKSYDYHNFGIIGEPYFDVDFSKVFYLTDTGRRWDGFNVSVRDKVPVYQNEWISQGWIYHTTKDMIKSIDGNGFPKQVMMTTHPQRWSDNVILWTKELCCQSVKNMMKRLLLKFE